MALRRNITSRTIHVLPLAILIACQNAKQIVHQDILKSQALEELRNVVREQSEWVKVHAAEFLIWAGYPDGVREIYLQEQEKFSEQPQYRIGIWRVLAQAAESDDEKNLYLEKIMQAFLDTDGPDRIHAVETLAKLEQSPVRRNPKITRDALTGENKALTRYARWAVAYDSGDSLQSAKSTLLSQLRAEDPTDRAIAAYSIRRLGHFSPDEWKLLSDIALKEPIDSPAAVYLLSAAFTTAPPDSDVVGRLHQALIALADAPNKGVRMEMATALADKGTEADIPLLKALLCNEKPIGKAEDDADVRAAAAYALIRILDRIE